MEKINDNLLNKVMHIQKLQLKLDKLKQQRGKIVTEIRSLSQSIPNLIRELELK